MRLTGDSKVVLVPQRGNPKGSVSIEVLTILQTGEKVWGEFCQTLSKKWTSHKTAKEDRYLNARPHWAKQWKGLNIRDQPIEQYFEETAYHGAFKEFREGFEGIVKARGGDLNETLARFGDPTMKRLIFKV